MIQKNTPNSRGVAGWATLAAPLALAFAVSACSAFDDEEKLSGERVRIRDASPTTTLSTIPARPLPPASRNADWSQTNGLPSHASGHLAGPTTLERAWRIDAGTGSSDESTITSAPIVIGGTVYVLDASSRLGAFDANTGDERWQISLAPEGEDGEEGFGGGLASEGSDIFVTTGFGEVLAVNPSGEITWRTKFGAPFRAEPAASDGMVIAVGRDNVAVALDASSGTTRWRVTGLGASEGVLGGASPAISGQLAVLPFASGEIIGVERATGRRAWSAVLGGSRRGLARASISDVTGDPLIAGQVVVAGNQAGRIVAINGQDGRRGWTRSIGSAAPMWAAGDSLFAMADDASLHRLSLRTGQSIWRTELPAFEEPEDREDPIVYSGPVLAGGQVLITSSLGELLSFDPDTGEARETADLSSGTTTGPVVAGGIIYVLADDGNLHAFR